MLILEAFKIRKYFSDRLVLSFDDLRVYSGDKIGIVGLNGSGMFPNIARLYLHSIRVNCNLQWKQMASAS